MEKRKFEQMVNTSISNENYNIINTVSQFHPVISDNEEVVELYKNFGMLIFFDMFPRAEMCRKVEEQYRHEKEQVKRLEETRVEIYNDKIDYGKWLNMMCQERENDAPKSMEVLEDTATAEAEESVDYGKMIEKLKRVEVSPLCPNPK